MSPRVLSSNEDRNQRILEALSRGPASAAEIFESLKISQASFSRSIQQLSNRILILLKIGGARAPQYALPRQLSRCEELIPVSRVDASGQVVSAGVLAMLVPRGAATIRDGVARLYDGLPPEVNHAAPSGFMGRHLAKASQAELGLPQSLKDWSDDNRVVYLCNRSSDVPGDLVFGNESLSRMLSRRALPPTPALERPAVFPKLAMASAADSAGTSSAGGEQPKFTIEMSDTGHVLVKYALSGTRMAELLRLEQLALQALQEQGLPAARTHLHVFENERFEDMVFLEIERFDRVGRHGRRGMVSAGAYDDEYFGHRDSWPDFARRLVKAAVLSEQGVFPILVQQAFSHLIGNTDTHFENLSLMLGDSGEVRSVAPAYDVLPMIYAPGTATGIDPALDPITPGLGRVGASEAVWTAAGRAALDFWARATGEAALSEGMRQVARINLERVRSFVWPLAPTLQ